MHQSFDKILEGDDFNRVAEAINQQIWKKVNVFHGLVNVRNSNCIVRGMVRCLCRYILTCEGYHSGKKCDTDDVVRLEESMMNVINMSVSRVYGNKVDAHYPE